MPGQHRVVVFVKFRPLPWYNGEEGAHSLEQIQNPERLLGELAHLQKIKRNIDMLTTIDVRFAVVVFGNRRGICLRGGCM